MPPARSSSLPAALRAAVEHEGVLHEGEHVMIACSGGPDSVALLDVLARHGPRWNLRLSVVSIDHGLRPEAHEEVSLARRHAERHGLPFRAIRLRVPPGANLQARARTARYEALEACARDAHASVIATGHTLDDQAETVLGKLLRGTGLSGLGAMPPRRPLNEHVELARPLLGVERAEVLRYLYRHQLSFREDPSNHDRRYLRTRVREEVLPLLRSLDPAIATHLAELSEEMRAVDVWRRREAESLLARSTAPGNILRRAPLREAPEALRIEALRRWLGSLSGPESTRRAHVRALTRLLVREGTVRLPAGRVARSEGPYLRIEPTEDPPTMRRC